MTTYEELVRRGLIAQVTDEEEIKELINNGQATFYIGFDCTADSLTAGHFMALTLMKRLQMAGNRPIALIGGGTTMIGDPSGRTDMRKMLTKEDIAHNAECFKRQMERFIEFGEGKALMLNNADWLMNLNYIELLREVGACFSVNRMLTAECYKQRMEKGLSFLEFNYYGKYDDAEHVVNDGSCHYRGADAAFELSHLAQRLDGYRNGGCGQDNADECGLEHAQAVRLAVKQQIAACAAQKRNYNADRCNDKGRKAGVLKLLNVGVKSGGEH